jgi:hypothetical protein
MADRRLTGLWLNGSEILIMNSGIYTVFAVETMFGHGIRPATAVGKFAALCRYLTRKKLW